MSDPLIGDIILFAGNFAPTGWAFCHGQLLPAAQNAVLFSIVGTTYGGDATNFALPDLRSRVAIGAGWGPGLPNYTLGQSGGTETEIITTQTMPSHSHAMQGSSSPPSQNTADAASLATGSRATPMNNIYVSGNGNIPMSATGKAGGTQSHNNIQPVLGLNYIICLQGLTPREN